MNNEESTGLDLLRLYKESLEWLTINETDIMKSDESVAGPLMKSFLCGEKIYYLAKDSLVSPFCLLDISRKTYYPFYFFRVKAEGNQMTYDTLLPFVNNAAISMLEDYGVHVSFDMTMEDISVVAERLDNLIVSNMLMDKIRLVPYFHFASSEAMEYNENFRFLRNYIFGSKDDRKYESLFREVEDKKKESQLQPNGFGFFSRMDRVFERESVYDGSSVTTREDSIFEAFLIKCISRNCLKRESTLILVSPDDEKMVMDVLKKHSMSSYVGKMESFNYNQLSAAISDVFDKKTNIEKSYGGNEAKRRQFVSFQNKRKESFSDLLRFKNPVFLESFRKENSHILDLNLSDYDEVDKNRDENFFAVLDTLPSILNSHISDHHYYGLTTSAERESYSRLQLVLISLIKSLKQYKEIVLQDEDVIKYELKADSLNLFEYLSECGKVLSQYDGFPRKYFYLQSDESLSSIKVLKKAYQSVSATNLILRQLCLPAIFDMDMKKLVADYEGKNPFKRISAKRKISKTIKSPKGSPFMTVYRVMKGYILSKEYLDKILPEYQERYGDSVKTMNGVVQIESSLGYVNKFHAFRKMHPTFDIEHPFIRKSLKDRQFLINKLKKLEEANEIYQNIKENLTKYISFYRDIPTKQLYDMSIDALIEKFTGEKLFGYDEFQEYVSFLKARSEASQLLSVIIQRYIRNSWSFSTLKNDYAYSIIYTSYKSGKQDFEKYENDYDAIRQKYIFSLPLIESEKADEYEERYADYLDSIRKNEDVSDIVSSMNEENLIHLDSEKERKARLLLSKGRFAYVANPNDLYDIKTDCFDHVIIINSSHFSNNNLLSSYRIGKKRIFLYYGEENDKRTQAYHETVITRDNIYNKVIPFSKLPESFLSYLKDDAGKHGYELSLKEDAFRFQIAGKNRRYGILPDVLLDYMMDEEAIVELSLYLSRFENITLIVMDTYGYLFGDEDIFRLMDEK